MSPRAGGTSGSTTPYTSGCHRVLQQGGVVSTNLLPLSMAGRLAWVLRGAQAHTVRERGVKGGAARGRCKLVRKWAARQGLWQGYSWGSGAWCYGSNEVAGCTTRDRVEAAVVGRLLCFFP